jgi:hypothetical protein
VADALPEWLGQLVRTSGVGDVAKSRDTEATRRFFALGAPLVVRPGGMFVALTRMNDRELDVRRKRDPVELERSAVDEQRLAFATDARGQLIHDPGPRADELVLRALREPRDRYVVEIDPECLSEGSQNGHAKGAARAEARAHWEIGRDAHLEASLEWDVNGGTEDVVDPRSGLGPATELDRMRLIERSAPDEDRAIRALSDLDSDTERKRDRENKALVVVGVLADQIDAARRRGPRHPSHAARSQ